MPFFSIRMKTCYHHTDLKKNEVIAIKHPNDLFKGAETLNTGNVTRDVYPEAALETFADHVKSDGVDARVHRSHVYANVVQNQEETAYKRLCLCVFTSKCKGRYTKMASFIPYT